MTQLKVCCIASVEEAELAIAHGANAIGLVSAMPSGPGVIEDASIRGIAAQVGSRVRRFLLTSRSDAAAMIAQAREAGIDSLQIVDAVSDETLRQLRDALPGTRLVQVIHVRGEADVDAALAVAPLVHELLLDSGNPKAAVKELGGTGRTHDWTLSRRIVAEAGRPVWLAGGLRPENVALAVSAVRPHGVDVCSGLREHGMLSAARLRAFVAELRGSAPAA